MPISIPSFHFASALQGFSLVRAVLGESSPSRPVRPPRFVRSDFLQACHIPGSFLDDLVEFESPEPTTPEGCYLLQLPNDVVISLCLHLDIFGILRLRQVNKRLYKLTHHGTVWKQLLRRSRIPLPPVPPTTRNSLEQLNGFEVERLLSRAYSVDKAWNSDNIRPYVHWQFPTYAHVLSMVVLPGGQFLVASVTDDYRHHYGVMVYTMDHRLGRCVAQARTETATKAYHLQAKYLSFKGELGIAIAYVRRDFKRASDRTRGYVMDIHISVYTDDWVDPEIPLKYECQVLHISLRALETLADPRIVPGSEEYIRHAQREGHSFKTLARIRTSSILGLPALDELFDKPYLALPKLPDRIIFQPLCGGPASILHCRNTEVYPDTVCLSHIRFQRVQVSQVYSNTRSWRSVRCLANSKFLSSERSASPGRASMSSSFSTSSVTTAMWIWSTLQTL
ncbi:hypothetical protein OBBRIDRAFT_877134 [Obba rivulosa]|uniref:F-box domain-containing protein n=1 Tax=Obba rivulosa TaxID=1052685 RepID=A0A8E2AT63_9APHY|nr:hypothetical protein OBBRIDRAFT_877134 [Obba rivulosa]